MGQIGRGKHRHWAGDISEERAPGLTGRLNFSSPPDKEGLPSKEILRRTRWLKWQRAISPENAIDNLYQLNRLNDHAR